MLHIPVVGVHICACSGADNTYTRSQEVSIYCGICLLKTLSQFIRPMSFHLALIEQNPELCHGVVDSPVSLHTPRKHFNLRASAQDYQNKINEVWFPPSFCIVILHDFFFLNTGLFMLLQEFISGASMLCRFLNESCLVEEIFCLNFKNKWRSFGKIQSVTDFNTCKICKARS